jgi:ABC-type Fe3+/spermidine/putrescine transport system ATPase subunit
VFNFLKEKNITCIVATHDKDDVLGYADNMIVLHNAKIIAKNTPQGLYNNPQSPLIASFFGEFNTINPYGIVYANQLKVSRNSDLKALVKQSYFNGKNYLIEAELDSKTVYFEHTKALKKESNVILKVIV